MLIRHGSRVPPARRALAAFTLAGLVAVAGTLIGAPTARAHQSSVVYSDILVRDREIEYTLQIASTDLYEAIGVDRDRPVTRDEVRAGWARLAAYTGERVHVSVAGEARAGGAPSAPEARDASRGNSDAERPTSASGTPAALAQLDCPPIPDGPGAAALEFLDSADGFFAVVRRTYRCPRLVAEATVRYDLFFDLDPRHQGIVRVAFDGGEEREQVFRNDSRTLVLRRDLGVWDHVRDYLGLGVEHIFTGYDHLAFLFALLIVTGAGPGGVRLRDKARRVLGVITAFTVAHSVTLIASALGLVALPVRVVEPAIALSIAYVAIENLLNPAPRHRWLVTFGFGLVHGFGFASVLKEIGLPDKGLVLSLLSFNLGVEVGQLAVVAALLPLLVVIAERAIAPVWVALALGLAGGGGFVLLGRFGVGRAQLAAVCLVALPALVVAGRRWGYDRVVRRAGSTVIALLAVFWFVERVLGRSFFGGNLG